MTTVELGHVKDKCWKLHPELQPKRKKAVLNTREVEEIPELQQADSKPTLMAKIADTTSNSELREELFHLNIQVKQSIIETIVDPGS